ncbi:hypothetical protein [Methylobacterium sp. NFXW15]
MDPTIAQTVLAAGLAVMGLSLVRASMAARRVPVRVKATRRHPRRED